MKKLLLFITGLLLLFSVEGQILRYSNYTAPTPEEPSGEYCEQYQDVYDAFGTPPNSTEADYQNTLVEALVAGGYWDRMDALYIFASNTYTNALINWINPGTSNATLVTLDSDDFIEGVGYLGDGDGYINTNWSPTSDGVNYTINDCSLGIYKMDFGVAGPANLLLGDYGNGEVRISFSTTPAAITWTINTYTSSTANVSSAAGFFVITRTASNATAAYENGSLVGSGSTESNYLPENDLQIMKAAESSYISNFLKISIFFVMDGTDSTDNSTLYNIFQTYLTAIGAEVDNE